MLSLLVAVALSSAKSFGATPVGKAIVPRGAVGWLNGWSGLRAQVSPPTNLQTPDGDPALTVTWSPAADQSLPNLAKSIQPTALNADVVAFWLRIDHPVEKLQVILSDADDVGAEQNVATLLHENKIEAGKWHYVVWPMRTEPGWVRYSRSRVDWKRIKSLSFYTWNEQIPSKLTMNVGSFRTMSFRELESVFQHYPERGAKNRMLPWKVLRLERPDRMMADYYVRRASEKVAALRQKFPARDFPKFADKVRADLAATYLLPKRNHPPSSKLLGTVEVDGVRVEQQLLETGEGVYSTALVYSQPSAAGGTEKRHKAILMLPGHGDPNWPTSVQSRCLSFVRQGYVVMFVQPMGQCERGEIPTWTESHDTRAMSFLLTAGESLLGLIMADHRSELSYLLSRPDVDSEKVAVTGVSMGGTHSLWLSAIDPRVKGAIAVAAAPLYQPERCYLHHGLCDVMPGVFNVADGEMISALSAPRALLHVYPSTERPVADAAFKKFQEGWINHDELMKRHFLQGRPLTEYHRYVLDAYSASKARGRYQSSVVEGPHDYTQSMRELAAGWLAYGFGENKTVAPIPEPTLSPIKDRSQAIATLNFWPQGNRPSEMLSPTDYVRRRISAQIEKLPAAPRTESEWSNQSSSLKAELPRLLGVAAKKNPKVRLAGTVQGESGSVQQWIAEPEPGIELPMLLFAPATNSKQDERLVVLLHPEGMVRTSNSETRQKLTREGAWVLCVDLRGMGETRSSHESSSYMGFRDMDVSVTALKLGETLAGYWTTDLLCAVRAAREAIAKPLKVTLRGELETGLIAILAAAQDQSIAAVETRGLLASCFSKKGYGLPFAYSDDKGDQSVRRRKLGGYGSMVPCIPHLLKVADIPLLMALVAPRPLTIDKPQWASGDELSSEEMQQAFAWPQQVYRLLKQEDKLRLQPTK